MESEHFGTYSMKYDSTFITPYRTGSVHPLFGLQFPRNVTQQVKKHKKPTITKIEIIKRKRIKVTEDDTNDQNETDSTDEEKHKRKPTITKIEIIKRKRIKVAEDDTNDQNETDSTDEEEMDNSTSEVNDSILSVNDNDVKSADESEKNVTNKGTTDETSLNPVISELIEENIKRVHKLNIIDGLYHNALSEMLNINEDTEMIFIPEIPNEREQKTLPNFSNLYTFYFHFDANSEEENDINEETISEQDFSQGKSEEEKGTGELSKSTTVTEKEESSEKSASNDNTSSTTHALLLPSEGKVEEEKGTGELTEEKMHKHDISFTNNRYLIHLLIKKNSEYLK
ncbi:uncharacterized protein LOC122503079 [Leptopilina heterotoma]|uniref:uncharacterized protein LOC122503079 n=1 Tax=Leptopilina heterotoma TaxID=63436 RepID=UPI001CA9491D|nr:uncharacterized protein LOC122503079 [Leptopilina heterotoma]